ncbi:hypothetical protein RGF97_06770 [Streptomyces roseicoloratus]|uniref:Uncharacterized protein n=1 Tax=Streptomyces roseicoloratus TaxID=2508722 RepID=A0ABY9RTR1_9ACTN|nr:hypothetical protein [Streptomyces roseicoloratus]WMX44624.1 hypothetical protein RGF97_06770 [Streptomyces roseicoloratus]
MAGDLDRTGHGRRNRHRDHVRLLPLPFDDANRTIFYTAALATWGTQGFVYFRAYRALHDRDAAPDANHPARTSSTLA